MHRRTTEDSAHRLRTDLIVFAEQEFIYIKITQCEAQALDTDVSGVALSLDLDPCEV